MPLTWQTMYILHVRPTLTLTGSHTCHTHIKHFIHCIQHNIYVSATVKNYTSFRIVVVSFRFVSVIGSVWRIEFIVDSLVLCSRKYFVQHCCCCCSQLLLLSKSNKIPEFTCLLSVSHPTQHNKPSQMWMLPVCIGSTIDSIFIERISNWYRWDDRLKFHIKWNRLHPTCYSFECNVLQCGRQ